MIAKITGMLLRVDFKRRVIGFNVMLAAITVVVIVVSVYVLARSEINREQTIRLEGIRELQSRDVQKWFHDVSVNLQTQASNPATIDAMRSFASAFEQVAEEEGSPSAAVRKLQSVYIFDNPNEIGKKDLLTDAPAAGPYDAVHRRYHPYFREYLQKNNYYDIFLVDADTGHIVYTVFKENDYATSLLDGQWKDTHLARVFREARGSAQADAMFATDFEPYAPSNDDPAYFKATPIVVNGRTAGVLIYQYSQRHLDALMHELHGLGDTGDAYLVGRDGLFRTNSRILLEQGNRTLLNSKYRATGAGVERAFAGETGVAVTTNYRGAEVISAFKKIDLDSKEYALIVEVEKAEAGP